ncbi:hypothetical protein FGG08_002859 [Glutinoglossum americanum]|uniref:Cytochrome P450 n=1 Tax=Glutinoglossum americanum TaxID=1670608 RepID=A0A9P8L199_9PEZI|nr:hypothetical protein FGG08_002859 [Glutinoglossum americanum]
MRARGMEGDEEEVQSSKTRIFTNKIHKAATTQSVITLSDYVQDLTVDIIGEVVMGYDFRAQLTEDGYGEKGPKGVLTAMKMILGWMFNEEKALNPFHRFNFLRPIMLRYYSRIVDTRLAEIIDSRASTQKPLSATRSILNLALQTDDGPLNPRLRKNFISQVKSFVFAGEDTTSTTVQWIIYQISKRPHVLAKLRAEHNAVFGDRLVEEVLAERPQAALSGMVYTAAVIKETLRFNPPAGTARSAPKGSGFSVLVGGERMRLDGSMLFVNHHIIHKNEKYWGPTASEFIPERWFSPDIKDILAAGAYRPFERGPRACMGKELALIESKVILALICREFDFEKAGFDGVTQEEVYDVSPILPKSGFLPLPGSEPLFTGAVLWSRALRMM